VQREETGRRSDQPILPTFSTRMKITIATGPIFPVPTVRGGAAQRVWEGLIPEFVKRGHEVTVFAREFPGQATEETVHGVRYVRRGGYSQSKSIKHDLVQCLVYALKTARHVPPADIVVTNDFWMPAVLPWLNGKVGRVIASIARFPKKQFFLYKQCAAIAPVSESVARGIREQTPSIAGKVTVVPNCVDAVFLRGGREQADGRTVTAAERRPVRILFVGRIHPEKGLELLVQALKSMKRGAWECILVGPVAEAEGGGGEAFAADLKREMEGLPVRFEAPVYDPEKLANVYDEADVFVYPSIAETGESFGIAPLEAMARGVVPVVSDLAVFREYLEAGQNGAVFNHRGSDAAANLARVLHELVGDAAQRAEWGKAARSTAERFSPAAIADKYLQLFEKVISGML
jgi:glycosyltransferase involved in cell wall biosynthesis